MIGMICILTKKQKHTVFRPNAKSISPSLSGLTIALDPGHIGGDWSAMERRHFSLHGDQPVKEGDLALAVAKI